MRVGKPILSVLCAIVFLSCTDNDERCGDRVWNERNLWCESPDDSSSAGGDSGTDTSGDTDSSTDSAAAPILGGACSSDADCTQYNANHCLIVQGGAGSPFCTLKDCSTAQDNCPSGYICCGTPDASMYPTHCMPSDVFSESGSFLCVQ